MSRSFKQVNNNTHQEDTRSDYGSACPSAIGLSSSPTTANHDSIGPSSSRATRCSPRTSTSPTSSQTVGHSTILSISPSSNASSHTVGRSATPASSHTLDRSQAGSGGPAGSSTSSYTISVSSSDEEEPEEERKENKKSEEDESGSDDEGDVFAQSYREGCTRTK
jgi:hypothetical protein